MRLSAYIANSDIGLSHEEFTVVRTTTTCILQKLRQIESHARYHVRSGGNPQCSRQLQTGKQWARSSVATAMLPFALE